MKEHLNAAIFRYILAHGPATRLAIALELGPDLGSVERALEQLLGAGLIGVTGHEPGGEPLYSALTA